MFENIKNYFNKKNLTDDKYLYLFDEYDGDEFICFDCETTGLDTKNDEIISIGAVIIKNNKILSSQKFEKLIKPTKDISKESIIIHRIRECDLKNAQDIDDVINEFLQFIGNRPLVGYYLEFDMAMVNRYIKPKLGINLPNKQIEVSALYYDKKFKTTPQGNIDLRFDSILKDLNLPILKKHDAINDAIMTAMMFVKLK
jgi:DNA polymerase-3 subunit epsilon